MTIEQLREMTKNLTVLYAGEVNTSFREQLHRKYKQEVLRQLNQILHNNEGSITQLTQFLNQNWSIIKSSSLCYTALPDDDITHLLVDVAQFVADNTATRNAISILMPTLALEPSQDDFLDFNDPVDIHEVLKTHVLSVGARNLLPIKLVAGLNLSAEITRFMNPYYDYMVHPAEAAWVSQDEYKRLIEHSSLTKTVFDTQQSYNERASDASSLLSHLRRLCQQLHMYSAHGGIGTQENANSRVYAPIVQFMEYFNELYGRTLFLTQEMPADLTPYKSNYLLINDELRYVKHDGTVENVPINDSELFKQVLHKLMEEAHPKHSDKLLLSVSYIKNLITKNGGHDPFDDGKQPLPAVIRSEIDLLLELITNPALNINATENLATCIGTRREKLVTLMTGNDALLSDISLSTDSRSDLINQAQHDFETARTALLVALNTHQYTDGHDELGINLHLLEALKSPLAINSLEDLNTINCLSSEEISSVCQSPEIRQQIMTQLGSIENVVIFFMDCSLAQLRAFLTLMLNDLTTGDRPLIGSATDLAALIISLVPEKCEIVVDVMHDLIRTPEDLKLIFKFISAEQRVAVFDGIKTYSLQHIKTTVGLSSLFSILSPSEITLIFRQINNTPEYGVNLFGTVEKMSSLLEDMYWLSEVKRTAMFAEVKNHIGMMIHSVQDVIIIFQSISQTEGAEVYEAIKERFHSMIKTSKDISNIFRSVSPAQCIEIFDAIKDRFVIMIPSATVDEAATILHVLNTSRTEIFEQIKEHIPAIIIGSIDVYKILEFLNEEQRTEIFEKIKHRIVLDMIKRSYDVKMTLEFLSEEQRTEIFEKIKHLIVPDMIKNAHDVTRIFEFLDETQRTEIFEKIKHHIPTVIHNIDDIDRIISLLTTEQRTEILYMLSNDLSKIMRSGYQVKLILNQFAENNVNINSEALKQIISNAINDNTDFCDAIKGSHPDYLSIVFEAIKLRLPQLISTNKELISFIEALPPKQSVKFIEEIQPHLFNIIKTAGNFFFVLNTYRIDSSQREAFLKAMQPHLSNFIKTRLDLIVCLNDRSISNTDGSMIIEAMRPHLQNMFTSAEELERDLSSFTLSAEKKLLLFEAIKPQISNIIKNYHELSSFLRCVSDQVCSSLLEEMQQQLPNFIKTSDSFVYMLGQCCTSDDVKFTRICESMAPHLSSIITTVEDCNCVFIKDRDNPSSCFSEYEMAVIFETLKPRLPDILTAHSNLDVMLGHFINDSSQSLYLTKVKSLLSVIKSINDMLPEWQSQNLIAALMKNNPADIKSELDVLIQKTYAYRLLSWNTPAGRVKKLITSLSSLDEDFKMQINSALTLDSTNNKALKHYAQAVLLKDPQALRADQENLRARMHDARSNSDQKDDNANTP